MNNDGNMKEIFIRVRNEEQLRAVKRCMDGIGSCLILDGSLAASYMQGAELPAPGSMRIFICMSEVLREKDADSSRKKYEKIIEGGRPENCGFLVKNLDELGLLKAMDFKGPLIGDAFLYAYNSEALAFYEAQNDPRCFRDSSDAEGIMPDIYGQTQKDACSDGMLFIGSDELTDRELQEACRGREDRIIYKIYGHQQLMITKQCLIKNYLGCRKAKNRREKAESSAPSEGILKLKDEAGEEFYFLSACEQCIGILYNARPTYMMDKMQDLRFAKVLLDLTIENEAESCKVLEEFKLEAGKCNGGACAGSLNDENKAVNEKCNDGACAGYGQKKNEKKNGSKKPARDIGRGHHYKGID